MKHVGLLCPPTVGHLTSMCSLGKELQRRQYRVTLFGIPDVQEKIDKFGLSFDGLGFQEIGAQAFPKGSLDSFLAQNSEMSGIQALLFTIRWSQRATRMMFQEAPQAIEKAGADFLLIDQITVAGGTIADHLKLPFITICSALPLDPEPSIPPYFTSWPYRDTWWAKLRNRLGYALLDCLTYSVWKIIEQQRQQWYLQPYQKFTDANSPLAQICQLPEMLDFPRQPLSQNFYYVNKLRDLYPDAAVAPIDKSFPFEQLKQQQPIIYASLGTLQNRLFNVFYIIAKACQHLNAQLIIVSGGTNPEELPELPGSPLVVKHAPQLELLSSATLTITHAGQNTVIESLSCGVPMVAIPIANDQPGIAARIAYAGVGEIVPIGQLSVKSLKATIDKVFHDKRYQNKASLFASAIQNTDGVGQAADIIEKAMMLNRSTLSQPARDKALVSLENP